MVLGNKKMTMWTPAKLPPHPSTVPTLSPFAQMLLDRLRKELNESGHTQPEGSSYQATVSTPNRSNEYNNFFEEENYRMNSSVVGAGYSHRYPRSNNNATIVKNHLHRPETSSDIYNDTVLGNSIFSNMITQSSNREHVMIQQNNIHSLSNSINIGCSNIQTIPSFMSQYLSSTEEPTTFTNQPTIETCDELSPNMEFEDMKVYSFPQGGVILSQNNSLNYKDNAIARQMPAPKCHLRLSYKQKLLNSKETQPIISQSQSNDKRFQNNMQAPQILDTNNWEPTDQTFIFSDKRSSPTFKTKLTKFKAKNSCKKTKTGIVQPQLKTPISPTNTTENFEDNICAMKIIRNSNKEQIKEKKEETHNCFGREGQQEFNCSHEMSDILFENTMKKYYNEENNQTASQVSTCQKFDKIENLENEYQNYVDMNLASQSEFSENYESLFTKTQDNDANDDNCPIQDGNLKSRSINVSSDDKFNKPYQEIENSRSFHSFDIDDLFSSTDSHSSNFETHKPNFVSANIMNDKETVVPKKHNSSVILKKEIHTSKILHQINSHKMLDFNFDPNKSLQNIFPKTSGQTSGQKHVKYNNEGYIQVVSSFGKKKPEPYTSNILQDKTTKPYQETTNNSKLSNDFDVEDSFTPKTQPQTPNLHEFKSNIQLNLKSKIEKTLLSGHKTIPLYSMKTCSNQETKTYTNGLATPKDSVLEENVQTPIQNKSTKVDDRNQMCFSRPLTQYSSLFSIEENKTHTRDTKKSENIKLHKASKPQILHRFCGKVDEENSAADAFTLLFENHDTDKPSKQQFKKKEEVISPYFTDKKAHTYKTSPEIEHPKNGDEKRMYQLNNKNNLNDQTLKVKTAEDVNTTTSGHLLNQPKKDTKMKQATLFDYKLFLLPDFREGIKIKTDSHIQNLNNTKTNLQFDNFKKPLPLKNKSSTLTKTTNNQFNTKPVLSNNKPKTHNNQEMELPLVDGHKTDCQGSYAENILDNKSAPSTIIGKSFAKTQSNKRTCTSDTPKAKKKPRFTAPVMASHSTSKNTALKNYTITVIDNVSANKILQRLSLEDLNKLVITVTFKEGYTLLNKPENPMKKSRCSPSGIMFMTLWGSNKTDFYWLQLHHIEITQAIQSLIQELFTKASRVVCFEAQAVFMLLLDVFHSKNISNWYAYDPLIGCWLLDPDNPPKDFVEVVSKLQVDKNLLVVNPKADIKTQACDLLPVLDIVMVILEQRLVNASLLTLFTDMEMKLTPILAVMELSSILIDVRQLHEIAGVLDKRLKQLQKEAHDLAGCSFQLNSHQQLRQILYDELKLDVKFNVTVKQTDQGSKSTSEAVLLQFDNFHPLPKIILEFRHLQKVKSTYVDGLIQFIKHDGTIGTVWEQVGAATGRITSKNPNLQAVPKVRVELQGEKSIYLRAVFKAREGFTFLAADFQQIEFRVFAHFTEDNTLLQAFRKGGDVFQELAGHWLGGTGPAEREKTKRIVYSVMYGAGANKLAEYLQVTFNEASSIIASFVDKFPCLRSLPRTVVAQCRTQGYIITLSGRRRLFPNIRSTNNKLRAYSERQAINFLIQGSAADICKAAMLDCDADLKSQGLDAKLLLQIHDELVWEVADGDLQQTACESATL